MSWHRFCAVAVVAGACLAVVGSAGSQPPVQIPIPPLPLPSLTWNQQLALRIPAYGHRNWIVIADSAYPAQSRDGIETLVTHEDHLTVVKGVFDALAKAKHIRPVVYLDSELPHVPEADAGGIGQYRTDLAKQLGDRKPRSLPHDQLIAKLNNAGDTFKVLVLKTNLTLPYTSVFLELDCGYWSPEAEQRLRDAMKPVGK